MPEWTHFNQRALSRLQPTLLTRTYVAEIGLLVSDLAYPDGAFVAPTIDDLPPAIRRAAEAMAREFYSRVAIVHMAVDLFGECLSHY